MTADPKADAARNAGNEAEDSFMTDAHGDGEGSEDRSQGDDDSPHPKNSKDPSRPRRKKARRACFACQRAHLTCGDERPCLRCIKRGLQDQCHDGVRKKAKYLHDAPPEALVPGMGGSYLPQHADAARQDTESLSPMAQGVAAYYPTRTSSGYLNIAQKRPAETSQPVESSMNPFTSGSRQNYTADTQQMNALSNDLSSTDQGTGDLSQNGQQYNIPFDPTDPHFFNFDISGLNFGNHYGAHEFAMLGHMSSAFDTPDDNSILNSLNYDSTDTYSPINSFQYGMGNNGFQKWSGVQPNATRQSTSSQSYSMPHHDNHTAAFAIGENGSISSASPSHTNVDAVGHVSSPVSTSHNTLGQRRTQMETNTGTIKSNTATNPFASATSKDTGRRRRDPSLIYRSVKEPYSYTTGFHLLKAFIVRRFSKEKTLRIAKSLASIRPSFISCTRDLSRDDLIFMEKGFQRNLLLYDDYISAYGCPTLICRRTGEVAAASKEFALLSGWRRDVLLGKEPNLNVNHGTNNSVNATGDVSGTSSRGAATPNRLTRGVDVEPGRPQPVFLAELLDDDTAVQFYDDFAKMAFGDSRGQVTRRGKILKYKTKDDPGWARGLEGGLDSARTTQNGNMHDNKVVKGIDGLGDKDGKVDVMVCHTVKRDTFDIPMMIIINFLPVIP